MQKNNHKNRNKGRSRRTDRNYRPTWASDKRYRITATINVADPKDLNAVFRRGVESIGPLKRGACGAEPDREIFNMINPGVHATKREWKNLAELKGFADYIGDLVNSAALANPNEPKAEVRSKGDTLFYYQSAKGTASVEIRQKKNSYTLELSTIFPKGMTGPQWTVSNVYNKLSAIGFNVQAQEPSRYGWKTFCDTRRDPAFRLCSVIFGN